jgi:hypothetical protein
MRRPSAAREALRFRPLVKASGADASRIKRVPFVSAGARPKVFLAGRPAALRAANARAGRIAALVFLKLVVQCHRFRGVSHKTEYSLRG